MQLPELNAGGVLCTLGRTWRPSLSLLVQDIRAVFDALAFSLQATGSGSSLLDFPIWTDLIQGIIRSLALSELLSLCIIHLTAQHIYRLVPWRIAGVLGPIIKTHPRFNYWPTT